MREIIAGIGATLCALAFIAPFGIVVIFLICVIGAVFGVGQ